MNPLVHTIDLVDIINDFNNIIPPSDLLPADSHYLCLTSCLFTRDRSVDNISHIVEFYRKSDPAHLFAIFQFNLNTFTPIVQFVNPEISRVQLESVPLFGSHVFVIIYPTWLSTRILIKSSVLCTCTNTSQESGSPYCFSVIDCEPFVSDLFNLQHVIRIKRDTGYNDSSLNVTATNTTVSGSTGLTGGALVAAIVVPILVVILLAVGGYFLYRWIRSRRADHGVYQPNVMENKANIFKEPDPQNVIKIPPEERLI